MKVAVIGAGGYAGVELMRLLSGREDIEIVYMATSQKSEGKLKEAKFAFLALQPKESLEIVPELLAAGKIIIDLSGAFRLHRVEDYLKYYDRLEHTRPDLLAEAVYGLPEINRRFIKNARLIAVPGCWTTLGILALLPLAKNRLLDPSQPIAMGGLFRIHRRQQKCAKAGIQRAL
ncbi:MAG: hypothetical protein NTZ97_01705 [Candidatus Moranbacteria bacterium]|nr:hypothetical protein [Candidatus Moranbacteria bacterium]